MQNNKVSKLQAILLSKQLRKQIDDIKVKLVENWDKYGKIKDVKLDEKLNESLAVKKQRLAHYKYLALAQK
ncbi:MAG: hypothetical protein ACPHVJ_06905 [Psychrobacter sp.]